jgi:hypothetical protein
MNKLQVSRKSGLAQLRDEAIGYREITKLEVMN